VAAVLAVASAAAVSVDLAVEEAAVAGRVGVGKVLKQNEIVKF